MTIIAAKIKRFLAAAKAGAMAAKILYNLNIYYLRSFQPYGTHNTKDRALRRLRKIGRQDG
jgi:hypothetical protein